MVDSDWLAGLFDEQLAEKGVSREKAIEHLTALSDNLTAREFVTMHARSQLAGLKKLSVRLLAAPMSLPVKDIRPMS